MMSIILRKRRVGRDYCVSTTVRIPTGTLLAKIMSHHSSASHPFDNDSMDMVLPPDLCFLRWKINNLSLSHIFLAKTLCMCASQQLLFIHHISAIFSLTQTESRSLFIIDYQRSITKVRDPCHAFPCTRPTTFPGPPYPAPCARPRQRGWHPLGISSCNMYKTNNCRVEREKEY